MQFAEKNDDKSFLHKFSVKTYSLPIADNFTVLLFYKKSKDGLLTSFDGREFYILDGKLYMLYGYNLDDENNETMDVIEVPEKTGQYFVDFLSSQNIS